jgi:hypothetical protein
MKILLALVLGAILQVPLQAASKSEKSLPAPKDIYVVAIHPMWETGPYFTADSLKSSLPLFKPITPHHKVGERRVCQSGVIVLKTKKVLFWSACYAGEIGIIGKEGQQDYFGIPGRTEE